MLPLDVARCVGQWTDGSVMMLAEQCQDCKRRTDRPVGHIIPFLATPQGVPCEQRIDDARSKD